MIPRYAHEQIAELWTSTEIYRRWFAVEVEHVRAVAGANAAHAMSDCGAPSHPEVAYWEKRTGHDVAGFLQAVDRRLQRSSAPEGVIREMRSALHYGLTSSDVVDTAMAIGIIDSGKVVRTEYEALHVDLVQFAQLVRGHGTIGRTHGQLAAPMAAEDRWLVLDEMAERAWTRVEGALDQMDVGKLSGPVGAGGWPMEELALSRLGLRDTLATQIVPRDRLAHLAYCLAGLATVCEAIVTQIWLLAQAGVGEIRIQPLGTVGSSAMPHKINPIAPENVRGLARMARSLAETLQHGVVQWGEHDLAHSSVERVAVPDLFHLVCQCLRRTGGTIAGMEWQEVSLPPDYVDTALALRRAQGAGVPYTEAHAKIRDSYQAGKIQDDTAGEDTH